jgi:NAD(P)H-dependent FMN reductase
MKIGIIICSIRPGRVGESVAKWVHDLAVKRDDAEYELVDLAEFDLPLLREATVPGAANRQYDVPQTRAWSAKIDSLDGFVWVTPEYNHGVPAAMKNAFDVLYPEWSHKAVGFVAYGADGGVRSVEHWRVITANARLMAVRAQVSMSTFIDFHEGAFTPQDRRAKEVSNVLDQVVETTRALAALRSS